MKYFFSSGTWIMKRKVGENVGCARDQNHFLLESWYFIDMIPGSEKNVYWCIDLQWFVPLTWGCRKGFWKFSLLRIIIVECG